MRVGTTSYIYPADMITNVRRLAGKVDDIELVLFEVRDEFEDLPNEKTLDELSRIAQDSDLTYTVHLPLDLRLADDDNERAIEKALRVITHTDILCPQGFIIHLEGSHSTNPGTLKRIVGNSVRALTVLNSSVNRQDRLCIENLENQPLHMLEEILELSPASLCIDVGHLWKQGSDPLPYMDKWLQRTRVVHLHGIKQRDHKGPSLIPTKSIDAVVELLIRRFDGILTIEVFSERDLEDWLGALEQSEKRMGVLSEAPNA